MDTKQGKLSEAVSYLSRIRYRLKADIKELDALWNRMRELRAEEGKCLTLATDGNACVLGPHSEYDKDDHVSKEQLEAGRLRGMDKTRPFHINVGKRQTFPGDSWDGSQLIPLMLEFDDGDRTGYRCIGWMHPEDVWRVVDAPEVADITTLHNNTLAKVT